MRISDWSSDVCSSDLHSSICLPALLVLCTVTGCSSRVSWIDVDASGCNQARVSAMNGDPELVHQMGAVCAVNGKTAAADRLRCHGNTLQEIGRASCRERVCQYV